MVDCGDTLKIRANYDKLILAESYVINILEHLEHIIGQLNASNSSGLALRDINSLPEAHIEKVVAYGRGTSSILPFERVHDSFEQLAYVDADVVAVEQNDKILTYGELDRLAESLAYELAELGASVGKRVAVVMQRCLEFPLSVLAVLKTGATLVPIDIKFPAERIRYMLEDSACTM
ncbi:hypothetical protein HDV05_006008, partial [Chytridiales sp. JEL 0842]